MKSMNSKINFFLASSSPRRKEILKALGYHFKIIKNTFEEDNSKYKDPVKLVLHNAKQKALDIKKQVKTNKPVIGFDTIVVIGKQIIGKPKNKKDAYRILKKLSNSKHYVITGFCIINNKKIILDYEKTKIIFNKLSDNQIKNYINSENVLDKAGAYAIQSSAYSFVKKIEGDYYNVVGLPIFKLSKYLNKIIKIGHKCPTPT